MPPRAAGPAARVIPTSPLRRALRSPGGRVLVRLFWITLALALVAAMLVWLWSLPEGAVVWPWQLSEAMVPIATDGSGDRPRTGRADERPASPT